MNCSAFNPTPSLSAAVVNHFKFKSSVRTFNLSGMGCAASVIAVDMARDMLKVGDVPCQVSRARFRTCSVAQAAYATDRWHLPQAAVQELLGFQDLTSGLPCG